MALTTVAQPRSFIQIADSHMIKVLGHTESLVWLHACALAVVRTLIVEYHIHQAAKLFQKHRGCYNSRSGLLNTDCAISTQLFLQQLASLRPLYRRHLQKYDAQFRKGIHGARNGQRDGMTSGTSGICVWVTGPVPVKFCPGHRSVRCNTRLLLLTLQIHPPNAGWGEQGEESTFVESISNTWCPWAPITNLGHKTENVLQVQLRKLLRKMRSDGMFRFRLSYISVPCKRCYHVF